METTRCLHFYFFSLVSMNASRDKLVNESSERSSEDSDQETQRIENMNGDSDAENTEVEGQASFDSDLRADWVDPRHRSARYQSDHSSPRSDESQEGSALLNSSESRHDRSDRVRSRARPLESSGSGYDQRAAATGQGSSGLSTNAGILTEREWRRRNGRNNARAAQADELEAFARARSRLGNSDRGLDRIQYSLPPQPDEGQSSRHHSSRVPGRSNPRLPLSHYTPVAHSTGIDGRQRDRYSDSESSEEGRRSRKKKHRHSRERRRHGKKRRHDMERYRPKVKVDPFPKDVPSSSKLSTWEYWLTTQELASETNGVTGQRQRAVDLRLSAGDEIGRIIMLEKLMPSRDEVSPDFRFYDYLVDGVSRFFRTMSDGNINAAEFQNTRQGVDENVNAYATRFKMIALKVGHVDDALATSTFIKGLKDEAAKGLALSLNMSIEDTIPMVMRREVNPQQDALSFPTYQEPLRVAEVRNDSSSRGRGKNRQLSGRNERTRGTKREHSRDNGSRGEWSKRQKSDNQMECWRCGRTNHRSDNCPAIDKECRKCRKKGHFEARCTKKVQKVEKKEEKVKKRDSSSSDQ
jgi:Zinc knuckle